MNRHEKNIGVVGAFFLIATALAIDGIQFLLIWIPAIGLVVNTVISLFAAILFIIWFSYWNVSFLDGKYAARGLFGILAEIIPILSTFPAWTVVVVWIIATNRMREKPSGSSDV